MMCKPPKPYTCAKYDPYKQYTLFLTDRGITTELYISLKTFLWKKNKYIPGNKKSTTLQMTLRKTTHGTK
jgi:hypothetical protein